MAAMQEKFINGAVALGHDRQEAAQIFAYIDEFANYGFNRSHAVAYSKLSFQLAYMKAHYPAAFFTAVLNANLGSPEKVRLYVAEAKARQLQVAAPHINQSQRFWTVNQGVLQMGLNNIRGLRTDFVAAVLAERTANGPFQSIQSFVRRLPEKFRKRDTLRQLVYAGALDTFGYNRMELVTALDDLIEAASFGDLILNETKIKKMPDWDLTEKLAYEKEAIGVNLSGYPLDGYASLIADHNYQEIADLTEKTDKKQPVTVIALIDQVRTTRTKKGEEMAFVTVSDATGTTSVTVFHQLYDKVKADLKVGAIIQFTGRVDHYNGKISVVANHLSLAPDLTQSQQKGTWFLQFDTAHDTQENRRDVIAVLKKYHGNNPVVIHWQNDQKNQQLAPAFWLSDETAIMRELAPLLGNDNVVFRRSH